MSAETPNPQPGDRVRVTFEGVVADLDDHGRVAMAYLDGQERKQYVAAPATVEVLERADDPKVGELRREDHHDGGHSIWQVQETYDGERFWSCVHSTAPGNRGVTFELEQMDGLPLVGAVPGTPAAAANQAGLLQSLPDGYDSWADYHEKNPYSPPARREVRVPNEPHGLPLDVRQKIANHLRDGDLRTAAVVAQNAGLADMDALSYIKDMSEYQTYLAAHGDNGPRVFSSDGPEPPADVSVVEWLAPLVAGQYRYLRRQDDGGWLWSTSPTAHVPEIPATSNTWAGATETNPGEYKEVV